MAWNTVRCSQGYRLSHSGPAEGRPCLFSIIKDASLKYGWTMVAIMITSELEVFYVLIDFGMD